LWTTNIGVQEQTAKHILPILAKHYSLVMKRFLGFSLVLLSLSAGTNALCDTGRVFRHQKHATPAKFAALQDRWSEKRATAWYKQQPWIVGCNFIPSTAINELEMWQADTYDAPTIDRELGYAQSIGFNTIRVFLHDIPWQTDSSGFISRIKSLLTIASKHKIKPLFVLFDDCWGPDPQPGKQPDPKPSVHNSGWVQAPGKAIHNDSTKWAPLENYTKGILRTFGKDKRILLWDLYNEPGNSKYGEETLPLLKKVVEWARSVPHVQPLSMGIWYEDKALNEFQLSHSDVTTFHNYGDAASLEKQIKELLTLGRPVICTEYMARTHNSRFITHLPVFKKYNIGAINWGLVKGKTNTIYAWDTPEGSPQPKIWFHDIFTADGKPFDVRETRFIKRETSLR